MRKLITAVIVGSIFVALAVLIARNQANEDDLASSIAQMVETSR